MQQQQYTKPFYMFSLIMPMGISQGFVTVALPFLLTQQGFPVALTAGIVAIGLSANLWRFAWGPLIDLSLSLQKWYWISLLACVASLLALCFIPFTVKGAALLTAIVFISQVAGTVTLLPINGFIAKRIQENKKGEASGWYQGGSLAGTGIGGGAGLWLATHYSVAVAGGVLCIISILFSLVMLLIIDIPYLKEKTVAQELKGMGRDVLTMIKLPVALFAMVLVIMPIGTGAMANLWSAVAKDWRADADTVALVTGLICGGVSAVGCVVGGFIADRWGVWNAYLGNGVICAGITVLIAVLPYNPVTYIFGVLIYGFTTGLIYSAFTAVIFFVIGKKHVATKYSLLSSLGNLPVVYVTAINGWTHDKFNSRYMLTTEAILGIVFSLLFILILKRMKMKSMIPAVVE